jgi:hypothetical protein
VAKLKQARTGFQNPRGSVHRSDAVTGGGFSVQNRVK